MTYDQHVISQIGVSVAVEAMLRCGFNVAMPVVDMGYDLLVVDGTRLWRVQVKSSLCRSGTRAEGRIRIGWGKKRNKTYSPDNLDAFVLVNLRTRLAVCVPVMACIGRSYIGWSEAERYGGVEGLRRINAQRC